MVLETLVSNSKRFCKLREHAHGACKVYTAALQHARGTRVRKISCPPLSMGGGTAVPPCFSDIGEPCIVFA